MGRIAAGHHIDELSPGAGAALVYAVADGLIAGPPLRTQDIFLRRRDLDALEALWPELRLAFGSNSGPRPLKQVNKHVTCCCMSACPVSGIEHRSGLGRSPSSATGSQAEADSNREQQAAHHQKRGIHRFSLLQS